MLQTQHHDDIGASDTLLKIVKDLYPHGLYSWGNQSFWSDHPNRSTQGDQGMNL